MSPATRRTRRTGARRRPWLDHWLETCRDLSVLKSSHPLLAASGTIVTLAALFLPGGRAVEGREAPAPAGLPPAPATT